MILTPGQRWRYKDGGYDFLVEILEIDGVKTKILQANSYSVSQGYRVGYITGDNGVSNTDCHGNVWQYLEGQDKPE